MNELNPVKSFRESKGLTQKEFADMCGVTQRTVQNWEAGAKLPDMVRKYLQILGNADENISSNASGNAVSVSAANGSSVNVGKETERLLAMLEHSQRQIDQHLELAKAKDGQISSLLAIVENLSKSK